MKNKIYLLSFFCCFLACKKTRQINTQDLSLKKGLEHFQKAYREYGDSLDVHTLLAYDSAAYFFTKYLKNAAEKDSIYQDTKCRLGYAYTQLERLTGVDTCFQDRTTFEQHYWYGNYLYKKSDYQKAYETFKSLEKSKELELDANWKAQVYMDMANAKTETFTGNKKDSLEIISLFQTAKNSHCLKKFQLKALYNLGLFFYHHTKESGYQQIQSAYQGYQATNIPFPPSFFLNYANAASDVEKVEEAKGYFYQEIHSQKTRKFPVDLAIAYNNFAVLLRYENIDSALFYYQKAYTCLFPTSSQSVYEKTNAQGSLSIETFIRNVAGWGTTYFMKYKQLHHADDLDTALHYYQKVPILMKEMRNGLGSQASKQVLTDLLYGVYEPALQAVNFLSQQEGKQDTALQLAYQFIEAGKSLNLLDNINNKDALAKSGIPLEFVKREERLQGTILDLEREFQQKKDANILKEKQQKESELAQLLVQLERHYPRYYELKYPSTSLTIKQIQEKCKRDNTTFIDFFQGNNSVCALYVSPTKAGFLRKEMSDGSLNVLSSDFTQLIDSMKSENDSILASVLTKFQKPSQLLYQLIFKELDSVLYQQAGQKVVLLLDGHLHKIAFDALMYAPLAESYLIKKYNFSYQPSAYLWYHASQNTLTSPRIAAFAPVFDATFYQTYPRAKHQPEIALSESEKTIENLRNRYDFDTYLREKATIHSFQQKAEDDDILHLATHAYGNDNAPDSTCFALAPNQKGDSTHLGRLYLENIYATPMKKVELALLTACETGKGKIAKGEGVMSLARAFRYAGCQRMITTLWSVDEKETMKTSEDFYAHLAQGKNYGDALYQAKLAKIRLSPRDWAGLILVGDAKGSCNLTAPQPFWKKWGGLFVLLGIGVGIIAWGFGKKEIIFTFFKKAC